MLPKNFPERKRQRQLRALEYLSGIVGKTKAQLLEMAKLKKRTADNKRNIRSKKYGGKERRMANGRRKD